MPLQAEHSVPRPSQPVHLDLLQRCDDFSRTYPNKKAFINSENHDDFVTFGQIKDYLLSVASYLHSNGFKKGEVICLAIPNCWELPVSLFGAFTAGLTVSGVSVSFTRHELAYQFKDSEAVVVLTDDTNLEKVLQATEGNPRIRRIICVRTKQTRLPDGVVDFAELLQQPKGFDPKTVPINMDEDLAMLPYSSGTTGRPKGVMITHLNIAYILDIHKHVEGVRLAAQNLTFDVLLDRVNLAVLPLYHAMGFFSMISSTWAGMQQIMFRKYNLRSMLQHIQDFKIRVVTLVPAIINQMIKSAILNEYDLSSLQVMGSASAPLSQNVINQIKKCLPLEIKQSYGMTELTIGCHRPIADQPQDSVGKLTANVELKVVEAETERELGPNQIGEIRIRGVMVMKGYKNRPQETADVFDNEGYLKTGDIGYYDERGFTYISDRSKELIKVKGYQVAPAELEDLILGIDGVMECAVVGVPDDVAGEVPRAFVVRKGHVLSAAQIEQTVAEQVAHYKRLAGGVIFVDAIPRTPSGKVQKRKLKEHSNATKSKI